MGMRIWLVLAAVALGASGCLGGAGGDGKEAPGEDAASLPAERPPGCGSDLAVAHTADGRIVASPLAVVGCLNAIGAPSFEPTIGITSDGSVFVYPASPLGLPGTVSGARSRDAGATWEILTPNTAGAPTHPYTQDPFLFVDPVTDRVFAEDLLLVPPTCGMMSFSDDLGSTWTHTQSGCGNVDHVSIFTGPAKSTPTVGYPHLVHRCAISGGAVAGASSMVTCQRSADGGMTWLPPGTSPFVFVPGALQGIAPSEGPLRPCSGGNGHGVTDADGTVLLPRGHCGQPWLAISADEGLTWDTVQVSDLGNACDPSLCEHDAGVGVDANGTVYYAWVSAERWLVLSRSRDGGHTWDEALNVTAPGLNEAALVQLAAGGAGKVALAYLGTSTSPRGIFDPGEYQETLWHPYMAVSYDADAEQPTFHTARLTPADDALVRGTCGPLRCGAVYDFIDVRIAPDGTPWAPYVDGCFAACAAGETETQDAMGLAGRLWNGPSLWDEADPNGPYPG